MEELKLKKIQSKANTIITTSYRYYNNKEEEVQYFAEKKREGKIITTAETKNLPRLVQRVINVGPVVHDVKEGDIIKINPIYYLDRKLVAQRESLQKDVLDATGTRVKETYSELDYSFPTINLNDEECLLLFDRDVEYIIIEADGIDYLNK